MAALFLSALVMASRPWGCSSAGDAGVVCDWVTSRVVAGVWLVAGLALSLAAFKRWTVPLAIISGVLIAVSLVSVLGVFTLAPAALWFACALWLRTRSHRSAIALSGFVSVVLLYLASNGVVALLYLHSTPI
jgi:hypothetical protein